MKETEKPQTTTQTLCLEYRLKSYNPNSRSDN